MNDDGPGGALPCGVGRGDGALLGLDSRCHVLAEGRGGGGLCRGMVRVRVRVRVRVGFT